MWETSTSFINSGMGGVPAAVLPAAAQPTVSGINTVLLMGQLLTPVITALPAPVTATPSFLFLLPCLHRSNSPCCPSLLLIAGRLKRYMIGCMLLLGLEMT